MQVTVEMAASGENKGEKRAAGIFCDRDAVQRKIEAAFGRKNKMREATVNGLSEKKIVLGRSVRGGIRLWAGAVKAGAVACPIGRRRAGCAERQADQTQSEGCSGWDAKGRSGQNNTDVGLVVDSNRVQRRRLVCAGRRMRAIVLCLGYCVVVGVLGAGPVGVLLLPRECNLSREPADAQRC